MDMFRCVIAELFTEGKIPFDLSQLLAYRSGDYSPSKLFDSIDDVNIRVGDINFILVLCKTSVSDLLQFIQVTRFTFVNNNLSDLFSSFKK